MRMRWWMCEWDPVTAEGKRLNTKPFKMQKASSKFAAKRSVKRLMRVEVGPIKARPATQEEIDKHVR